MSSTDYTREASSTTTDRGLSSPKVTTSKSPIKSLFSRTRSVSSALPPAERGRQDEFFLGYPNFIEFEESEKSLEEKSGTKLFSNTWTQPPGKSFFVRGPDYHKQAMKNATSLKQPSEEPLYDCIGLNIFKTSSTMMHSAKEMPELKSFLESHETEEEAGAPKFLIINWTFSSLFGSNTLVQHLFKRKGKAIGEDAGVDAAFAKFLRGDDNEKNSQFKYLFKMVDGASTVKSSVQSLGGERPVIIAKKLKTTYHSGSNYLEISMDVGSSYVASTLNGLIMKTVSTAVLDCAWLLEASTEEELPERVLATVRWFYCDPHKIMISHS